MKTPRILTTTIAALLTAATLHAQTWDGGGAAGGVLDWITATNWAGDVAPVNNGTANIIFAGLLDNNPGPNLDQNWSVNSVTFNNTAGAFTLGSTGGFTLTVGVGGVTNNDTQTQTISHSITLGAAQTWNAASGGLNMSGGTLNNAGNLLTVTGASDVLLSTIVTGAGGLTKSGTGVLTLSGAAANTFSGPTLVNAGVLILQKSAAVNALTGSVTVGDGVGTDELRLGANSQIPLASLVTVANGGLFNLNGFSEGFLQLAVSGGSTTIGAGTLTLSTNLTMTAGSVSSTTGALVLQGSLITIAAATSSTISGNLDLAALSRTFTIADGAAAIDLDVSALISNGSIAKAGAGTLRLAVGNTFAGTFDLNAGTVLVGHNAAFGASLVRLNGGTIQADTAAKTLVNAVTLAGNVTVAGPLAIDTTSSFSITGNRTLTVADAGGLLSIGGTLTESAAGFTFTKDGPGALALATTGVNTFAGTTVVNAGTLQLSGNSNTILGNVIVGDDAGGPSADVLRLDAANQIANTSNVEVRSSGLFQLTNGADTIGSLTLKGGVVDTGVFTLTLNGNVTGLADAITPIVAGNLSLGIIRTFTIADGTATNDLLVSALISTGGIVKDGPGTLRLDGANTFNQGMTLNAGTLALGNNSALGTAAFLINGGTLVADGAPRSIGVSTSIGGSFAIGGTQDLTFAGQINVNALSTLTVNSTGTTTFSGVLNLIADPALLKAGPGVLVLAGTAPNLGGGLIAVTEGTLVLQKTAGVAAITNSLSIGDALGGVGADIARLDADEQIANMSSVAIAMSGLFNLNGFNETIGGLTLVGSAQVATGAGTLTLGGNVTGLVDPAATVSAVVAGNLNLGGATRTFTLADAAAIANDVDITAVVANGGITKGGLGTLRLSGSAANTFTGAMTVNAGALTLAKTAGVNAIAGPLVIGDGTGAVNSDVVTLGANEQIPTASQVTITNSGLLNLAGFTETISDLVFAGGNLTTGAGVLRLDASFLGVTTNANFRTATISGNILLDGGVLFVTAGDGSAAIDLDIPATITQSALSSGVLKDGTGLLRLSGNNTFTNGVSLNAGTLAIGSNGALGTLNDLFAEGGTVQADGAARTIGNIYVTGSLQVSGAQGLTVTGILDLPGGTSLTKSLSGTLTLQNPIPDWSGALTLNNGTLNAGAQTIRSAGVFTHNAGTFIGTLTNLGTFTHNGGGFNGLLVNQGTANFNANFTAASGITSNTTINLGSGITLSANGAGLVNDGTLTLSNSTLAGSGPLVSNNFVSGFGTIGGTGGFTNNGLVSVSGGNLVIANTGANSNAGNIDLPIIRQLRIDTTLGNSGTITLASTSITGAGTLTNSAGGIVTGRGTISAPLANSGGTLRADGGTLTVTNAFNNSGIVRAESGASLFATSITNQAGGQMILSGTLSTSGALTNSGGARITLRDGTGQLTGAGALANSGLITGEGIIAKSLTNAASGELRAEAGRTLVTTGAFAANAGTFSLQGGTLEFASAIVNSATGFISGRGALRTQGLTNQGVMAFSGGTADIFGDVTNSAGARIVTSGAGAVTTFYDDVIHNGLEIFTGANASTVFFGGQSGAGSFTGTGTVYFNGDLRPGNSPASVLYEGDLVFGGASTLTLELGGLLLGSQYDHLNIGGTFTEDGALDVVLYNGFAPHFGDTFDLFDAGAIAGNFDDVNLPSLPGGLAWDDSQLASTGTLRVVPEPGIGALLASVLALLGLRRGRAQGAAVSQPPTQCQPAQRPSKCARVAGGWRFARGLGRRLGNRRSLGRRFAPSQT